MATGHGEDGGGTLARGTVIPGNGNIFLSIHPRGHLLSCLIGNVLRHHVREATASFRVQRPPAMGEASCPLSLMQVTRLLLHRKCNAGENGIGRKPWGDSLGLEGYDFEVDTESFSVRKGGKDFTSQQKSFQRRACQMADLPNIHNSQNLGNFTPCLIEKSHLWSWTSKNKKIIHLIFICIWAEKCLVWKSHPSKVENHTRQANLVTVLSEI